MSYYYWVSQKNYDKWKMVTEGQGLARVKVGSFFKNSGNFQSFELKKPSLKIKTIFGANPVLIFLFNEMVMFQLNIIYFH